jgi:muramoyltetrapeptide carboxypeptidase
MIPSKLKKGDTIRIISPARSLAMPWINEEIKSEAYRKLTDVLGLKITFGKHVNDINSFNSSNIKSRVEDIHEAFLDTNVKAIITVIGGYNSNELLGYLDYDIIKRNPKIFCGYSDITAIQNAIYTKTGMITYSGVHFFDFGEKIGFEYSLDYFMKCLFDNKPFEINSSDKWSSDKWGKDQLNRHFFKNEGIYVVNQGNFEGTIIGGNLVTFHSLLGSEFRPSFKDKVLFLEEDSGEDIYTLNRNLTSLTLQKDFSDIKGIVFGRFSPESKIGKNEIKLIVENNPKLKKIPIVGGVDFGHTTPKITFPIGGKIAITTSKNLAVLTITKH